MRASEIINEVSRPTDRWIATEILDRSGWEVIGSGSFASIYEKEGVPYVLKLFDHDDTAYLAFLNLVKSNPNEHFPRLRGKPFRVSPSYYAVRMEKLSVYRGMPDLFAQYLRYRDETIPQHGWLADKMADAEELFYEKPSLKVALDLIHTLLTRYQIDITPWNLMMRGNTVVFTDPVCNPRNGQDRDVIPVKFKPVRPKSGPASKALNAILDDDELLRELLS